eukprot:5903416-Amphidinium_carterae.1
MKWNPEFCFSACRSATFTGYDAPNNYSYSLEFVGISEAVEHCCGPGSSLIPAPQLEAEIVETARSAALPAQFACGPHQHVVEHETYHMPGLPTACGGAYGPKVFQLPCPKRTSP